MKKLIRYLIFFAVILCGCRENTEAAPIINYTLPDVSSFDFSEFQENGKSDSKLSPKHSEKWLPHGNYVYVKGNARPWTSAMFNIKSIDTKSSTAEFSYIFASYDGTTKTSDGIIKSAAEISDNSDGTRTIIIYIDKNSKLKFSGNSEAHTAFYFSKNGSYSLKQEG